MPELTGLRQENEDRADNISFWQSLKVNPLVNDFLSPATLFTTRSLVTGFTVKPEYYRNITNGHKESQMIANGRK